MEDNNGESLENFSWYISQKFEINESDLISCLINDKNNYWNTLFSLIKEKRELMNGSEAITDNNSNKENENENKDDIIKEIDNYFKENPEEVEPTWNKYKKEVLKISNAKTQNEKAIASKLIDKKINNNNNNKMMNSLKKKAPPTQKRKQSFAIQKDNIQKFNFSIGFPSNGPQGNDNILRRTMNFPNNYNTFMNKPKNKKTKFAISKPNKNENNNKLRNSMYLKIKKNPNFEYAPKSILNPKDMRKSINQNQNRKVCFKFNLNNSNDNNQKDNSVIKISKKQFNELIQKNSIEENENEFGENIYEEIEEKDEDKSTGKKEENSDYKSEYKVDSGYNEEKILSFEDSDIESKMDLEDINNHNDPIISEKNKELTNKVTEYNIDNKPDYSKDYELSKEITNQKMKISNEKEKNKEKVKDKEESNIPLYKNKINIFTLKKSNPKSKVKPSSDKKQKPKIYINLSLCHQVKFSLNIKNNVQNLSSSVPNLLKEKQNETNKTLESLAKNDAIKKNNSNIKSKRSDQKPVKKNLALKNQRLGNNRSKIMNNNNKNNISYQIFKINSKSKNMNINMKNKNNLQTRNINNTSFYNMKMNKTFYKYNKTDIHKSDYLKTSKKKDYKIRPLHNSQQNLKSKDYIIKKYNNNNNKYNKINNVSGINKLKKDISEKNRSSTIEKGSSKKRKKNRVINEAFKSKIKLTEKENEIKRIKNNYLKKYKETIENIMKNDDTIFSENSNYMSYNDRENRTDRSDSNKKNNTSLSYHRTKIKIRKPINSKSKISPNKTKKNKVASRNVIKRYIHSSMDNIY